ncbi:MAG: chemotaxis protein CheB [Leptolyngbyaceae cyanobacterium RM2_2_4]|nr:chemotaxis protein CheB [Leptolyngbyaceae cyanobacterium SL_5_14]NJO50558.1 chemotaxis protein CheB [Leptolyngbyaceae cyanobacterium RM2_2_4]
MFKLVVIGTSLGGLSALKLLLAELPDDFPAAIAVVQHRHRDSEDRMSSFLRPYIALPIKEVVDKDDLLPGTVYVAPADYHLLVEAGYFTLSTDEPVSYARPSIDVLFESAADVYGEFVIGVILTGANQDGAKGLAAIKAQGGSTIVQEPSTAESATMPEAAIATAVVDWVLPLSEIAPHLTNLCQPVWK